jgi:hypothetical protein
MAETEGSGPANSRTLPAVKGYTTIVLLLLLREAAPHETRRSAPG